MSMRYQAGFLTASYFPLQVPNAPTIGTATASSGQVSTTFTAPSNVGGGAITSYIAVAKDSSSGALFTNTGASSPIVVTGLTNGNTYTVTVAATNAYGTGPRSAASNSITPVLPLTVEYLVVAGGGGAGCYQGGGAGGFRTASGFAVSTGSAITVTVGAGGAGVLGQSSPGATTNNGTNSVFSTITSAGGGAAGDNSAQGKNGGSGGGGGWEAPQAVGTGNTPSVSPSQGNNGGLNFGSASYAGGAGGGASVAGGNGTSTTGGAGGNGTSSSITGSAVTYAGGGGGSGYPPGGYTTAGAGGTGGGGAGSTTGAGANGTANTGGGGGGSAFVSGFVVSASGGSGIVVIRYADTFAAATSTTGSPTITVTGGYRIYQWTSSGSITF